MCINMEGNSTLTLPHVYVRPKDIFQSLHVKSDSRFFYDLNSFSAYRIGFS